MGYRAYLTLLISFSNDRSLVLSKQELKNLILILTSIVEIWLRRVSAFLLFFRAHCLLRTPARICQRLPVQSKTLTLLTSTVFFCGFRNSLRWKKLRGMQTFLCRVIADIFQIFFSARIHPLPFGGRILQSCCLTT